MTEETASWAALTARLVRHEDLEPAQAAWAMDEVMSGNSSPVQLAAFLVSLESKGVTSRELGALADRMVAHARPLDVERRAVDIVGTGGDMAQTVNISTMASIIIAASGRRVIKHGNRASTSRSGSADVLDALGVRLDLPVEDTVRVLDEVGIAFLFAQVFHPSMRFAAEARKGLGIPSVFNVLGPITNPARPLASAVGVANRTMAPTIAQVFAGRGTSALVFRGQDGLDELSVGAPSDVWEVRGGQVRQHLLDPEELLGVPRHGIEALRGGTAEDNADVARGLYEGTGSAAVRDAVLLNAAAGLLAHDGIDDPSPEGDFEDRFRGAFAEATRVLDSGAPARLLADWARAAARN
ncbi:anthranilate phosphoribosyltransferase [Brachybacterium endophyticum]|uniref:Anthranilate phosphoribosyltransferase n=1 Tax=Brachybacterium endophyticum TaxID=2182385 RepID=A0A2U2RJ92_9MICO|nr:anthranilate phosphoribosyltransferase [Brachybacterium endophyticum]PWH05865.1 anthranilate phosphoribosyltransferase [Brachybacterium endophyticum]